MKKLLFSTSPLGSRLANVAWLLLRLHLGLSVAIGAGWGRLVNMTTAFEAAKLASGGVPLSLPAWFTQQVSNLGFTYPSPSLWARLACWLQRLVSTRQLVSAGAAAVALFLASACWAGGSLNSDLTIEPGKQFALGGGQPGAFRVVARNKGKVPVEIKERPRGGGIFGKATLAPGQRATLRFLPGSTALLLNPSDQNARLDLHVTGDTNLSMGYEANGKQ